MLSRAKHYQFDESNPFEGDPLGRETCAHNLTRLIESDDGPLVMTVSARWGHGKTTFIRMWQAHLRNEGFSTIYFDAWENDLSEDPLISFMAALEEVIATDVEQSKIKTAYDKVKDGFKTIVRASPKIALSYATRGVLTTLTDDDPNAKQAVNALTELGVSIMAAELEKQKEAREVIAQFKSTLSDYASEVSRDGKPLVIFIDDLDRCRPKYAVELLERIKHLFAVDGIVFILAVDRIRLGYAAAGIVGFSPENDADGYLRRFIDLDFYLPEPDSSAFLQYWGQAVELPPDYLVGYLKWAAPLGDLADHLRLSLRVQQQVLCKLRAIWMAFPNEPRGLIHSIPMLLMLLVYDRQLVTDIWIGQENPSSVLTKLEENQSRFDRDTKEFHGAKRMLELFMDWFGPLFPKRSTLSPDDHTDTLVKEFGVGILDPQDLRRTLWRMVEFGEQFKS